MEKIVNKGFSKERMDVIKKTTDQILISCGENKITEFEGLALFITLILGVLSKDRFKNDKKLISDFFETLKAGLGE